MTSNLLRLNSSKIEFILMGLNEQLKTIPDTSISFNLDSTSTHTFTSNSSVSNLGVIFDQNLSFSDHITHLSRFFLHVYLRSSKNQPNVRSQDCLYGLPSLPLQDA